MLATAAAGTSQPVLAALLGLGAAGLAGAVVAMAWSVHIRQIRLAELLTRRQFILTREPAAPEQPVNGHAGAEAALGQVQETLETVGAREAQAGQKAQGAQGAQGGQSGNGGHGTRGGSARPGKLVIDGPETVVVGEQVRYRVRPSAVGTAVTDFVSRRSVRPSRTRTWSIRLPGRSAMRSSSSGWVGSGACDTEPPPAAQVTAVPTAEGRTR